MNIRDHSSTEHRRHFNSSEGSIKYGKDELGDTNKKVNFEKCIFRHVNIGSTRNVNRSYGGAK